MRRSDVDLNTYNRVHAWIRYKYGPADRCENKRCPNHSKNFEWALKKGCAYESKRESFFRLCSSCHHKYDLTEEFREKMRRVNQFSRRKHCKNGHEFTLVNTWMQPTISDDGKSKSFWRRCRACAAVRRAKSRAIRDRDRALLLTS